MPEYPINHNMYNNELKEIKDIPIIEDMSSSSDEDSETDPYEFLLNITADSHYLSFAIIPSPASYSTSLDDKLSITLVTGTQAPNEVVLCRFYELDGDQYDDYEDVEESERFKFFEMVFTQTGGSNRIRQTIVNNTHLIATMSTEPSVNIWNISSLVDEIHSIPRGTNRQIDHRERFKPLTTFKSTLAEGFGLDWSIVDQGYLAAGDENGYIFVFTPENNQTFTQIAASGKSIEDIQWSPTEAHVLSSCSCDGYVRIWDTRSDSKTPIAEVQASYCDINVISWSKTQPLLLSGDDEGVVKVWDIRRMSTIQGSSPSAMFTNHTDMITSLEWHPTKHSCFSVSSFDNRISFWDLAVQNINCGHPADTMPPQLIFAHLDDKNIKEIHWHPQIEGILVSVDDNGFTFLKHVNF